MAAWMGTGISQTNDPLYALVEIKSSDDLEYEKFHYNSELLLEETNYMFEDGMLLDEFIEYDEFNNLVKLDRHQMINGNWVHVSYIEYTYDLEGNRTSRSNYNSFGGTTFTLGGVYNYYYENNVLTNWELLMGGTDLVGTGTLTYNAEGKVIQELGQESWSGPMEDSWKIDYVYNEDNTLKTTSQSFWNGSSWDAFAAEWFSYDDLGNCILWEHKNGGMVTNKFEYEYNHDFTTNQIVFPFTPEYEDETHNLVEFNSMRTLSHWYTENDMGDLVYVCDYIYDYDLIENMGTSNPSSMSMELIIYPNPTSDVLNISVGESVLKSVNVLDNSGRNILKENSSNKKDMNLNVSHLTPGVYFVQVSTSKGTFTKRFVVK